MNADRLVRAGRLATVSSAGMIDDGAVAIQGPSIAAVGTWSRLHAEYPGADVLDARDLVVAPGLVDSHSHNLEFGAGTKWGVGQAGQLAGAATLLLDACRAGVTAMGEHILGHYAFKRPVEEYRTFAATMPQTFRFAVGGAVIGTEPLSCSCALMPGQQTGRDVLLDEPTLRRLAALNEFPGENCFATITPANLPVAVTPHAGERTYTRDQLGMIARAYQADGHRFGAHMEGPEAIADFLFLGGNVIHHGHGLTEDQLPALAERGILLCATPSGGTSRRPNAPDEIAAAVRAGVVVAIATDSVLPVHPEVTWLDRPPGALIESSDLMYVAQPAIRQLIEDGYGPNEALALITLNGARVIGLEDRVGSIEVGKQADLVFATGFPALEAMSDRDVRLVMIRGEIVLDSRT